MRSLYRHEVAVKFEVYQALKLENETEVDLAGVLFGDELPKRFDGQQVEKALEIAALLEKVEQI